MILLTSLKVLTVIGTRPEIIRLSRIICALDNTCNHILVHTGQNYDYELNQLFFDDLGLRKPDYFLSSASHDSPPIATISNILTAVDRVLDEEQPDAVLVLGDTNSCLSVLPAKRRQIPIFHMEAGNRCFDSRVPEEINRKIVDHIADVNLTYSSIAREYLLREGLHPSLIIKTGSPIREVLDFYLPKINQSSVLDRLSLDPRSYFVVSSHREETVDDPHNLSKLSSVLNKLADHYQLPIIVSTHPRTRKRIASSDLSFNPIIQFCNPLGFFDYVFLQKNAKCVLSDSGTITEESSILSFPAVNLRDTHERPEGMEESAVVLTSLDPLRVLQSVKITIDLFSTSLTPLSLVSDYSPLNVSAKVVRIIHSYVNYVNIYTWRK